MIFGNWIAKSMFEEGREEGVIDVDIGQVGGCRKGREEEGWGGGRVGREWGLRV